jgi:hypothetical protein
VTNGSACPPECQKELKHLWKKFDSLTQVRKEAWFDCKGEQTKQWEIIDSNYKHWEAEVGMRVKTQTLITVVGIVVTIVLALLGLSFRSLNSGLDKTLVSQDTLHKDVAMMQRTVDRMQVQMEVVEKYVDKRTRRPPSRTGVTGDNE